MSAAKYANGEGELDEQAEAGFFAIAETINIYRFLHTKKKGSK